MNDMMIVRHGVGQVLDISVLNVRFFQSDKVRSDDYNVNEKSKDKKKKNVLPIEVGRTIELNRMCSDELIRVAGREQALCWPQQLPDKKSNNIDLLRGVKSRY